MAAQIRRTRDVRWKHGAAGSVTAAGLMTAAAATITTSAVVAQGSPPSVLAVHGLALTAGVAAALFSGKTWLSERARLAQMDQATTGGGVPASMASEVMPAPLRGNPAVLRLLHIVSEVSPDLLPIYPQFALDDEGNLTDYAFRSVVPGKIGLSVFQNKLEQALRPALPGANWEYTFDPVVDTFTATSKSSLPPSQCAPIPHLVTSPEEAAERWHDAEIPIGVSVDGIVPIKMRHIYHRLVVGVTGGGKSVFVRDQLGAYLAAGAEIMIADGKGTDYIPLREVPNISAMGLATRSVKDYCVPILMASRMLDARRAAGMRAAAQGDNSWRTAYHPVLLIMDEWEATRATMKGEMTKDDLARVDAAISNLLKIGREFRVFVMLSTQNMLDEVIPREWRSMFQMTMSVGKLDGMVISKSFPAALVNEVRRVSDAMPAKAKGRSMIAETPDEGAPRVRQVQTFWSYSPAESLEDPNAAGLGLLPDWARYKEQVYDQLRQMYPRVWVDMEELKKSPPKELAESSSMGWLDMSKVPIEVLAKLPLVRLDDPADGFRPDPTKFTSDPFRPEYAGNMPAELTAGDAVAFGL